MMWSISGYKQFIRCPHQWSLTNKVADDRVKNDPFRKEVTILSKLQSVQAWRGSIVDDIISRLLVNAINSKLSINKDYFLKEAFKKFDQQFEYAIFQKYRETGSIYDDSSFAALFPVEFGWLNVNEDLQQAREDIRLALCNLLDNKELISYLKSSVKLVSQRPLIYQYNQFSVKAKPDLIAFFNDKPPHIFDWKVHTYGTNTYDEQLVSYAVALYRVNQIKPHTDFPTNLSEYKLHDYKLTEYQLLHNERLRRDYIITEERLADFYTHLSSSMIDMFMAGAHKPYAEWGPENYTTTDYPENCRNCAFQKICK